MRIQAKTTRRGGFTLVELLVVMALITLIMSLLSQAFVEGLATVRNLKAIGDMQESLRSAIVPMRYDLVNRHFNGTEKLSSSFSTSVRPTRGFFRIQQGLAHNSVAPPVYEGMDSDALPSYRVTTDILHLSVSQAGSRRADYLSADAPPALDPATGQPYFPFNTNPSMAFWTEGPPDYQQPARTIPPTPSPVTIDPRYPGAMNSQWAEVMWFVYPMLDPTGTQMTAGVSNTPLFNLHRRQRLMAINNNAILNGQVLSPWSPGGVPVYRRWNSNPDLPALPEIACKPDSMNGSPNVLYFASPDDMIQPRLRSMMNSAGTLSLPQPVGKPYHPLSDAAALGIPPESFFRQGDDRIITDVLSFEIKVLLPGATQFVDIATALGGGAPPYVYDTATWPGDPTIRALQIIIRVWDARTEQSRQMTLIQDM